MALLVLQSPCYFSCWVEFASFHPLVDFVVFAPPVMAVGCVSSFNCVRFLLALVAIVARLTLVSLFF